MKTVTGPASHNGREGKWVNICQVIYTVTGTDSVSVSSVHFLISRRIDTLYPLVSGFTVRMARNADKIFPEGTPFHDSVVCIWKIVTPLAILRKNYVVTGVWSISQDISFTCHKVMLMAGTFIWDLPMSWAFSSVTSLNSLNTPRR